MSKGGICISTLVVCASHTFIWAQSSVPLARGVGQSGSASDMSRIPAASRSVVTAALGSRDSRFRVQAESRGFHADNRPNGLAADFTRTGIELRRGGARFGLTLSGFGYGSALRAAGAADPQGNANRVEYQRGPLTEWYVNGPLGLEQGFTLKEQPGRRNGQPLTIALRLSGELKASVGPDATSLTLSGSEGRTELRYTGLAARDSTGRDLHAWIELQGQRLLLQVDDAGARYPVVVDPFIQQAVLTVDHGAYLVAISSDGNTVAVGGAPGVEVFVKVDAAWANVALLSPSYNSGNPSVLCDSVALSGNGNTVLCGLTGASPGVVNGSNGPGQVSVFVKPVSGWASMIMKETARLYASDLSTSAAFGDSVSSSQDGRTLLVGAEEPEIGPYGGAGAAYLFVEPPAGWPATMSETAKLTAADGVKDDRFGFAVAMSPDGNSAAVTAYHKQKGYVFQKLPSAAWQSTNVSSQLVPSLSTSTFFYFGTSIAVNTDGSTVAIGATEYNTGPGGVFVFVKTGGGWTMPHEAALLTATDGSACDGLGETVAVSGDGSTVLAGASLHIASNTAGGCQNAIGGYGAAYEFVRPAGGWDDAKETFELASPSADLNTLFGASVALSADASTLAIGAYSINDAFVISYVPLINQSIAFGPISPVFVGDAVSLNAVATSGLPVSFTSQTTTVCTIQGTTAYTFGAGTCTIQATQAGSPTYAAATPVSQSFTVSLRPQTITFIGPVGTQSAGTMVTLYATASSNLPVTFTSLTLPVCTVSGTTVSLLTSGTCTIQASQGGNYMYSPAAPVVQGFMVSPRMYVISGTNIEVFNSSGSFLFQFGGTGSGPGQFQLPSGITIDLAGNVWVTDASLNRVQKFDSNGNFLLQFGSTGTAAGFLYMPYGIAVDLYGNVWVADTGNNRVEQFSPAGTYLREVGGLGGGNGQFNQPVGITFDTAHNLLVADTGNSRVQKFDMAGSTGVAASVSFLQQFATSGNGYVRLRGIYSITVDPAGNIWVADSQNQRVAEFDSSGANLQSAVGFSYPSPWGAAADGNGNIWAIDYNTNRVLEFNGAHAAQIFTFGTTGGGPGQLYHPTYIAVR